MKVKAPFIFPELSVEELSKALYKANLTLEETNQTLQKLQKERIKLFTNISHDLRSPISAIRSSIEYLETLPNPSREETAQTLQLIQHKSIYLEQLINDVFLLSSLESMEKVFHYERMNIGMFLEEFFYSNESDVKYATRNLLFEVPTEFPYEVEIDGKMIYRVLDNLFNNALKYSKEGASITLNACKTMNHTVQVSVKDTGIGIAKNNIDKIFNRTYMVHSSRTPNKVEGCGLGLSIAKSIIERHNGTIWCESTFHVGSTFHFTLPIVNDTANIKSQGVF